MICPQCRSGLCLRSRRGGFSDFVGTLVGLRPWRCQTCDNRFYARRVAIPFSRYAHCPRCGNFDLDRISKDRVEDGTLLIVKRLLGFSDIVMVPFPLNQRQSVGAPGLPRSVYSADTEIPLHRVAIDHSSEGEYISRFGAKYNVTYVDRAFYPSRLIGALEVAGQIVPVLF